MSFEYSKNLNLSISHSVGKTDYIGLYLTLPGKAGYAMHGLKESSCHIKYNYFVFHYRFIINRIRAPKALHRLGKYHLHNGYV